MKNNCALNFFLLICLVNFISINGQWNFNDERGNLTKIILRKYLSEANVSRDFLIASGEILRLIESLKESETNAETSKNENQNENENEVSLDEFHEFLASTPKPIIVANTLHGRSFNDIDDELTAKLENPKFVHSKRNETLLKLINSVDFKSRWTFNFQKRDTHKRQFYHNSHGHISHIYTDAMRKDDIFGYALLEELNASALELSLQRNEYKMLILLPHQVDGLKQLERQLAENLDLIEEIALRRLRPTYVRLFMPKFKITHKVNLHGIFEEFVNSTLLESSKISHITQESHIYVNEGGIGELDRTTVLFWNAFSSLRSTPEKFDMAHPFLFVIKNDKGIQFLGHLTRPHV